MMRNRLACALLLVPLAVALLSGCAAQKAVDRKTTSGTPGPSYAPQQPASNGPSDMYYQDYGDNPRVGTAWQPVSTFAVDVDTASYTLTRNYMNRGMLPPPEAIRAEEFINYFPQSYPAPGGPVAAYIAGGPSPFRPTMHLVQIGLQARGSDRFERKPAVLTFVIDTSGSMNEENRLGLVKESLLLLLGNLQDGDRVGIVAYGSEARLELPHTADQGQIRAAIQRLQASGSTNAEAGLRLGYAQADRAFAKGAINRVILASDGVANVGVTGPDAILREIEDYRARGITLTTVGVGMGNYNDVLLEQLADKGDGEYAYVDTAAEARRIFVRQLDCTLENVAKDVKVQVRFDPDQVASYRLVGYENRVMNNSQFRNDSADGGEMGAGQSVTALYEVQLKGNGAQLGTVSIRYKDPGSGEVSEQTVAVRRADVAVPAGRVPARVRWSAAVAEFAGILGKNPWAVESRISDVLRVARPAAADLDNPPPHREAIALMEQALRLSAHD